MDGKPWKAGKFAFSLRVSLWAEHLGLNTEEVSIVVNKNEEDGRTRAFIESNPSSLDIFANYHMFVNTF